VAAAAGDEEVKAVVVLSEEATLSPVELIEYLVPRMPSYWVPRFIEFADELPKTPSFKLKKAELRARGVTKDTWDRERAGLVINRQKLA
jgi:crotonobetaine/carnitine-CoA ligase